MWFRLYTLDGLSARRFRKRAITAIVLSGLVIIGIILAFAAAVPRQIIADLLHSPAGDRRTGGYQDAGQGWLLSKFC
jgi:hypothetical protein